MNAVKKNLEIRIHRVVDQRGDGSRILPGAQGDLNEEHQLAVKTNVLGLPEVAGSTPLPAFGRTRMPATVDGLAQLVDQRPGLRITGQHVNHWLIRQRHDWGRSLVLLARMTPLPAFDRFRIPAAMVGPERLIDQGLGLRDPGQLIIQWLLRQRHARSRFHVFVARMVGVVLIAEDGRQLLEGGAE